MPEVSIRTFTAADWRRYRDLRLRALEDSPDAFGTIWADARKYADSVWQSRLEDLSSQYDFPVVAESDGIAVGMAWCRLDPSAGNAAQLFQMWVAPEHRGLGISRKILNAVIDWSMARGAASVFLAVTCGDTPAAQLYRSSGFEAFGEPEPLRIGSDSQVQPMKLII